MGVLSFFAKRQEILSSNGFLSVERSFLYTHPNTRNPSQVQSKRPFAYEKGILWPHRWQQNSLAPVEICRLAPIQPEVITWNICGGAHGRTHECKIEQYESKVHKTPSYKRHKECAKSCSTPMRSKLFIISVTTGHLTK